MSVKVKINNFSLRDATFMWPKATPGPFDAAGAKLVGELARVGWEVPGIDVEIDTYGSLDAPMRIVRSISGVTAEGPFLISFANAQGRIGEWNISTGVNETVVPNGLEMRFYSDNSGPAVYLYTGTDWPKDGSRFINSLKVNSKLNGEPKTYLKYSGNGSGSRIVKHDPDVGREYSPDPSEYAVLEIGPLVESTRTFIQTLIAKLETMPSAPGSDDITEHGDANMRRICAQELIPAPEGFPTLYARAEIRDVVPLLPYMDDEERRSTAAVVLHGNGSRLANFGVRGPLPDRAYDGFDYASTDPMDSPGQVIHGEPEKGWPVIIDLKWLNSIFVVDNHEFERSRDAYWENVPEDEHKQHRVTEAALNDWVGATARTMVPAAQYDGSFTKPVYVIGRILATDEARLALGRVRLVQDEETVRAEIIDADTDVAVQLVKPRDMCGWALNATQGRCEDAAFYLTGKTDAFDHVVVDLVATTLRR